ncbi:hypothetical protein EQM14_04850 [Caproiciproducens sp. NJN-50]|uniref:hypothetical protein n=1 Tax=Caproiciproducens sp. NJN-50 TaxID=2507162 RepID=UPI000FFDF7B3|nr:hypothetical protein [Caproiciproducens sp. NJN-50]QAT49157.1 hypothetical protein EQM14_04850 [Caproiciproducens sp. NJN-50]
MKTIDWHRQGYIPILIDFQNGNTFIGSVSEKGKKEFRYRLSPAEEKIRAEVWYGPYCYEKSETLDQSEFSMDMEGREKMVDWLKSKYESMIE